MNPLFSQLVDATLGIDIGSTNTRACLFVPSKNQTIHIENTVERGSQAFRRPGDYSSTGFPFEPDGPVYLSGDVDRCRRETSLKFGFYPLADVEDEDLIKQYVLVQPLMKRKNDPIFRARLRQGLVELLITVNRDVQSSCRTNGLKVTRIGLSVPSQWTLEFEDVYRDIVEEVFCHDEESIQIFFHTETEALAHFLLQEVRSQFHVRNGDDYAVFLFLDFGGHNMNGCIFNLVQRSLDEDPSFYRIGDSFGVGGGSEHWTYHIGKKILRQMKRMLGIKMSTEQQHDVLENFNGKKGSLGPSQAKASSPFTFAFCPVTMSAEDIAECFERGHKDAFHMAKEEIERISKYRALPQVVVSGGTAKHPGVRARLQELCDAAGIPEPFFVQEQTYTYSSGKIAHGAAMAASNSLTIPEFMERGAAFGLQTRECPNRGNTNPDKSWNDIAYLLLSQNKQEAFPFYTGGRDEFKIICDPYFESQRSENLKFDRCYDVLYLGKSKAGCRSITLSLVTNGGSTSLVIKTTWEQKGGQKRKRKGFFKQQDHDRVEETESPPLPMYFDGGTNCAHVDLNGFDITTLDFGIERDDKSAGKGTAGTALHTTDDTLSCIQVGEEPIPTSTQMVSPETEVLTVASRFPSFDESPRPASGIEEPVPDVTASPRRESSVAALPLGTPASSSLRLPQALEVPVLESYFQAPALRRRRLAHECGNLTPALDSSVPSPKRLHLSQVFDEPTPESSSTVLPPPKTSFSQNPASRPSGRSKPIWKRGKAPEFDVFTGKTRFPPEGITCPVSQVLVRSDRKGMTGEGLDETTADEYV